MNRFLVIKIASDGDVLSVKDQFASFDDACNVAAAYNNRDGERYDYGVATVNLGCDDQPQECPKAQD